jgi:hypothetical protein
MTSPLHVFIVEFSATSRTLTVLPGTCAIARAEAEREIDEDERLVPSPGSSVLGRLCRH